MKVSNYMLSSNLVPINISSFRMGMGPENNDQVRSPLISVIPVYME